MDRDTSDSFTAWRDLDLAEVHRVLDTLGAPQYAQASTRLVAFVSLAPTKEN